MSREAASKAQGLKPVLPPQHLDMFKIEDAKFLSEDPYEQKDKDPYYKDGNFYYDDDYYYAEAEDNQFSRHDEYYLDQIYYSDENPFSQAAMNGGLQDERKALSVVGKVSSNQIDLNGGGEPAGKVIESSQSFVNTDYPDDAARNNNSVVYSTSYAKIEMNKSDKSPEDLHTNSFPENGTKHHNQSSEEEDVGNSIADRILSKSPVKITEATHDVRINGNKGENEGSGEKIMLVTPSSTSYNILTDNLTLEDIHNFTYEGFNLVELYKNMLKEKVNRI